VVIALTLRRNYRSFGVWRDTKKKRKKERESRED